MAHKSLLRRSFVLVVLVAVSTIANARSAHAQGFISPSVGYNFGGDSGCPTATDCEDKNWNWGIALGALGSIVGFEAELTYEDEFRGQRSIESASVTTVMGNFMIAPRISVVQPYGLVGVGLIRTDVENLGGGNSEAENQIGWTIGGGLIVFVQRRPRDPRVRPGARPQQARFRPRGVRSRVQVLGVCASPQTVMRDWPLARAWLTRELKR
jgi:opacity protein-like surface antigen